MERHAFPADLAADVLEKWTTKAVGVFKRPPLPSRAQLLRLLEAAYLAGHETEEGRPIRFTLCCTPEVDAVRRFQQDDTVEAWRFASPRPFDVQELKRLAVTTDIDAAAIWVRFPDLSTGAPEVAGILNLGRSWAAARQAFSLHYDALPDALIIRVDGPGTMTVYQGQIPLATLDGGRLHDVGQGLGSLHGIQALVTDGHQRLSHMIEAPRHAPAAMARDFEWTAYTNLLLALANAVKLGGHGGALVLAGSNSQVDAWVKLKYRLGAPVMHLAEHYMALMAMRHRLADLQWKHEIEEGASPGPGLEPVVPALNKLRLAYADVRDANQRLAEACGFIGQMAGADGAIVMGTDLGVLGFGGEIMIDRIAPAPVYEVTNLSLRRGTPMDSEQFGMRHRSAMRLVTACPDAAVFVVSQDGGVSLVFNHQDRVFFRRNISTTNAHMAFT